MRSQLLAVAVALGSFACGGDGETRSASTSTTVESPFAADETTAILDAIDTSGARDELPDGDWLRFVKSTCEILGPLEGQAVEHGSAARALLDQFSQAHGDAAVPGLAAGAKIACPVTGFLLAALAG